MAMTLRLHRSDELALAALAKARGTSKHEAALQAIQEAAARAGHEAAVAKLSQQVMDRYADLVTDRT